MAVKLILSLFIGLFMTGCDDDEEDEKKGFSINAPQVLPPVARNTPAGFGEASLKLADTSTPEGRLTNAVQGYLTPAEDQAVGAQQRLQFIDNRMAELDTRAQETEKVCLLNDASAYTLAAELPGEDTYSGQYQCQENLDGGDGSANTSQLAFGLTDSDFFLFERTGSSQNAVLARATIDGTTTEFWQMANNEGENFIHLIAQDNVGIEFTAAGTGTNPFDCGIHFKSNATLIYVEGYDSTGTCSTDLVTLCLNAEDLSTATASDCTDAELNTFTLDTLTPTNVSAVANSATSIITTPITGYVDFTESVEVEDPPSE